MQATTLHGVLATLIKATLLVLSPHPFAYLSAELSASPASPYAMESMPT